MTKAVYMINQLPEFQGSRLTEYKQKTVQQAAAALGYEVEVFEGDEEEFTVKGAFGHSVLMPLKFERLKYDTKLNGQKVKAVVPELVMTTAILTIDREKMLERTPVEGADGTVKEFSSFDDWKVNIDLILLGDEDEYPEQQLKRVYEFEKAPKSVEVSNDLFRYLEIWALSIKRISLTPMVGVQNAQAVKLECYSDLPLNLKLKGEL